MKGSNRQILNASISLVAVLLFLTPFPAIAGAQIAASTGSAAQSANSVCAPEIGSQFDTLLANVNSAKAIELAESSPAFLASVGGLDYEFDTVSAVATYTHGTCGDNMELGQLSVDFNLQGTSVTASSTTVPKGVQVFENPQMTTVLNVTMDSTIQGITYWSGYEAHYMVSGSTYQEYSNLVVYDVPSVSWNGNCYYASPYECEMSIWAGLSNSGGGGGFLLQSGVDVKVPCTSSTSCSSTVYTPWWEWVPHNAAQSCGSSYPVSSGDQITSYEANGAMAIVGNGNSNDYQAFVEDPSASPSWVCGSGWQDIASPAYYGQSIIETPSNGCCPVPVSWGTLDMQNNDICPSTSGSGCVWWSNSNIVTSYDTMDNYCTALGYYIYNINVGLTINGVGTYTQAYNNNCDF